MRLMLATFFRRARAALPAPLHANSSSYNNQLQKELVHDIAEPAPQLEATFLTCLLLPLRRWTPDPFGADTG